MKTVELADRLMGAAAPGGTISSTRMVITVGRSVSRVPVALLHTVGAEVLGCQQPCRLRPGFGRVTRAVPVAARSAFPVSSEQAGTTAPPLRFRSERIQLCQCYSAATSCCAARVPERLHTDSYAIAGRPYSCSIPHALACVVFACADESALVNLPGSYWCGVG